MTEKPKEPTKETIGRYAEPLWDYRGQLMSRAEASAMYEADRATYECERAEALASRLKQTEETLEHAAGILERDNRPLTAKAIREFLAEKWSTT